MLICTYLLLIIAMAGIDQISKYVIVIHVSLGQKIEIIKNFFNITYVRNYGAGFSILQNQKYFFYLIGFVAIIGFGYLLLKDKNNGLYKAAYLMIIGGTIGNLADRLTNVYVVDFLDFYIFGYDFPVFNFADCFLTIGCFILLICTLLEEKSAKNKSYRR